MAQVSIGEAMKMFVNKSPLRNGLRALQIEELWEKLMGSAIAKYTDKIEIINKTLFVRTHVAVLKQELIYQKDKIKERVNEALGENIVENVMVQ